MTISSPPADLWEALAAGASAESRLWTETLRPASDQRAEPVFSPLAGPELALGLETIYEGYLVHYGRSRLFATDDRTIVLLLGDYLYAHGLVRVAEVASAEAVADLAELISLCAQLRAEGRDGDGVAWAGTTAALGSARLAAPREALAAGNPDLLLELARSECGDDAVATALAAHARHVG